MSKNQSANKWHINQLDAFVKKCDDLGGVQSPNAAEFIYGFELELSQLFDHEGLNPLTDEYHNLQMQVYEEISGRKYNPIVGEQAEVPQNIDTANPLGVGSISNFVQHSKVAINALMLADLNDQADVLDMGCGWGITSEIFAFNGAKTDALDINPSFLKLVSERSQKRGYGIKTIQSDFGKLNLTKQYDMIFFYECLHHAVSVKKLIARLKQNLKSGGCIIFAGEPITQSWWGPDKWGMRLDPLSVYCMRKYGWFETGWSENFIMNVFNEAGWKLTLAAGIGLGHGYIGYAVPSHEADDVKYMGKLSKVIPPNWATVLPNPFWKEEIA